jgi:hypothetical protein
MKEISKTVVLSTSVSKIIVKPKSEIKVQRIGSFREMMGMGVDFRNLKRAVLIGDYLIAEDKPI